MVGALLLYQGQSELQSGQSLSQWLFLKEEQWQLKCKLRSCGHLCWMSLTLVIQLSYPMDFNGMLVLQMVTLSTLLAMPLILHLPLSLWLLVSLLELHIGSELKLEMFMGGDLMQKLWSQLQLFLLRCFLLQQATIKVASMWRSLGQCPTLTQPSL